MEDAQLAATLCSGALIPFLAIAGMFLLGYLIGQSFRK